MTENYKNILNNIDLFIRRYHTNKLLYGVLVFLGTIVFLISLALLLESYFQFNSGIRAIIFYGSIILILYLFFSLIVLQVLALFNIAGRISRFKAVKMISARLEQIEDKLVNVLELKEKLKNQKQYSEELIHASIEQKAAYFYKFKFRDVISLKSLIQKTGIVTLVVVFTALIYSFKANEIIEASKHYVNYNIDYKSINEKVNFELLNHSLTIERGENLTIRFNIVSKKQNIRPAINFKTGNYIMKKDSNNTYSYNFNAVNADFEFFIAVNKHKSKKYKVNVIPQPNILNFQVEVKSPVYTGIENAKYNNIGDLKIAEGSHITWSFYNEYVDTLVIKFKKLKEKIAKENKENQIQVEKSFYESENYSIDLINSELRKNDILKYRIDIIKDKYPEIQVERFADSSTLSGYYFIGEIEDDYGLNELKFLVTTSDSIVTKEINVPINNNLVQEFYFYYEFNELNVNNEHNYFFQVWDNDAINGSKSTKSKKFTYKKISNRDKAKKADSLFTEMEKNIYNAMELSNDLNNDIEKLRQSNFDNSLSDFEKRNLIDDIIQKKEKLENKIENLNKNFDRNKLFKEIDEQTKRELKEKQKQIEELIENLLTDEIKELIEELKELQKELINDNELNKVLDDLEFKTEDLSQQMENALELLKKLEVESRIEKTIQELKDMAKDIEKIENETGDKKIADSTLNKKLEEQEKDFKEIMKDYEKTQEMNSELKFKMEIEQFKKESDEIEQDFNKALENTKNGRRKKSKEDTKKLKNDLNELAMSMQNMLMQNQNNANMINAELLNNIIANIIQYSFDQEALLLSTNDISTRDPIYLDLFNDQKNLNNYYNFIREQIDTLSANTPVINSIIRKDINEISEKIQTLNEEFEKRRKSNIVTNQQLIMTAANNLALKLNEILENMNNSAQQSANGQNADKPAKPKPGLGDLKQQQESFKNQLKNLIEQMKQGKGNKPGNEQLAKMLAQQEMLRQLMDELSQNEEIGRGARQQLNEIKRMMDENIKDIVNRQIDNELLRRQDLIKTRLLQAENAEREREREEKRRSEENLSDKKSNNFQDFEYNKENFNFSELLINKRIKFKRFYKDKSRDYFESISKSQ